MRFSVIRVRLDGEHKLCEKISDWIPANGWGNLPLDFCAVPMLFSP